MEKKITKTIALLLLSSGVTIVHAQQANTATGGNASGSGGSITYSVGQVVYTTSTGTTGSVAQGVQQAFEIFTVGIKETALDITLVAFPNPTTNNLALQISDIKKEKLVYQLYDMQGKLINNAQIVAEQTQIDMSGLSTATYFVHITNQDNKKIQSFKIIKN